MKILITGINGFVGKTLYRVLAKDHEVLGIYNNGSALSENCFRCDLTNLEEAELVLKNIKSIDVIVHLASKTASAKNLNDFSVLNCNTVLANNIAALAKSKMVKHIINLSSSSVYPNVDGVFDEMSITNPASNSDCIYGLSKLNSEVILDYHLTKSGITVTHLRTTMIHGPGMDSSRLIPVIEKEIEEHNSVTLFGNGERLLNLIHVEKLAAYISFFVDHPVHTVMNVGEECISVLDLARRIISEKGNPQTKLILKQEGNRSRFVLDIKKLNNILSVNN